MIERCFLPALIDSRSKNMQNKGSIQPAGKNDSDLAFFCPFFDLNLILYDTVIRPRSLSCVFLNQIHMGGFSKRLQSVQIMLHFIHPDVHTRAAAAAAQRTIVKLCALSLSLLPFITGA